MVPSRSLHRICGVSLAGRVCNEELHRMAGTNADVTVIMKKNVLNWYRLVEKVSNGRMAIKIYDGKVSGKRNRG